MARDFILIEKSIQATRVAISRCPLSDLSLAGRETF